MILGSGLGLVLLLFIYSSPAIPFGPILLQVLFFLLVAGLVACCGMWIWRIMIAKVSIPTAEKKLILYAALYLVGILAYFIIKASR